ncbi:DUF4179 domain-containing protein [Paenibacillus sp. FSL K6-1230]|uniref:DUF4179 domain-containing protein n=1 Tax=Paenibacillus sp. FSL K6-1230 TaxID=2921603 RepID=UPI0030F52DD9
MKTEQIPSFKKEIDSIPVPIDRLDQIISATCQEEHPRRPSPTRLRKKVLYRASAAVATLGLLLGSGFVSPAMASIMAQIPVIGSIFVQQGDPGLRNASEQGLTTAIGETRTNDGSSMTINEVFYDGIRLSVAYSLVSQQPLDWDAQLRTDITVNGKETFFNRGQTRTEITPTYHVGIIDIDPPADLPDQFELGLLFHEGENRQWKFNIPVIMQTDTQLITVNHKQRVADIELNVANIKSSAAGMLLTYNTITSEDDHSDYRITFKMKDQEGRRLVTSSGGTSVEVRDGIRYSSSTKLFAPLGTDVTALTITPYLSFPTSGEGVAIDEGHKESLPEQRSASNQIQATELDSFTVIIP